METMTDKGDPVVLSAATVDMRVVNLSLGNTSRMGDDQGGVFLPDKLNLEWRNDVLTKVKLSGRALRTDGNPWITEARRARIYLAEPHWPTLEADTPDWVLRLIKEHSV